MKKTVLTYVLIFSVLATPVFAEENTARKFDFLTTTTEFFKNINFSSANFAEKFNMINFKKKDDIAITGTSAPILEDDGQASSDVSVKVTEKIVVENADVTSNDNEKKSFWGFWKKNDKENQKEVSVETIGEMLPDEDAANTETLTETFDDAISSEKLKAIEDANSILNGSYLDAETYKNETDLVEGSVQTEKLEDGNKTSQVEGYIQETVIFSLDDCIKKALENNPQIRSAFNNSEIYKTKIGQAWANYFPTFGMTNGLTRNRYLSVNFPVPQQYYTFYNAMDLQGSMLLFDFGKTKAIADVSKRTYEATIANLDETINNVVYDVKAAYYSLLHALEKQNVYSDSVKSYELQLKQAESFYMIGTKPKIDVTMAQYNLGNAQLGLIKATNEVALALAQLNNAMGVPEEDEYKIVDKLVMNEYTYDFDSLLKKAYESRPELLAYQKKAKASEILIRAQKRAFLPDIEAVGAFAVGGGAKFSDDYGWTLGAQFSYQNTNLFLLKKQFDEAKATHEKDLADLEVMEQGVYLQVKQAYVNLKNAQESIPVTALSLKHAKEQFDLAVGRYSAGVGDAIELKDSEITYRNARLDYLSALLQYNVSVADVERVVGFKLPIKEDVINK